MGISIHTLRKGLQELHSGHILAKRRIRRDRGEWHAVLPEHPEWVQAVVKIIGSHMAGLPQDEEVIWMYVTKTQMQHEFARYGYEIYRYHITQILASLRFRERYFDIPMRGQGDRNGQFEKHCHHRKSIEEVGVLIISYDTSKFVCDNIEIVWSTFFKE